MEANKKNNIIKVIVCIVILVLIVGVFVFANNKIKQQEAEKRVEEAKKELQNAIEELQNLRPNMNNSNSNVSNSNNGLSNTTLEDTEIQDYINNYFVLQNAKVEKQDSYSGKRWGIGSIQVKNNGKKTVKGFEITVFFQDDEGNNIAENDFYISPDNELKPNYSWKQDEYSFYEIENITSEVNPKKHTIKVTDLDFEE